MALTAVLVPLLAAAVLGTVVYWQGWLNRYKVAYNSMFILAVRGDMYCIVIIIHGFNYMTNAPYNVRSEF